MENKKFGDINKKGLQQSLKRNPFTVPQGYFSMLKEETLLKTKIQKLGKSSFITPRDYQKVLNRDILTKVKETRLKNAFPSEGFNVPPSYFDNLQNRILEKTALSDKKSKSLYNQNDYTSRHRTLNWSAAARKWIPYATAASIAFAIALFAIFGELTLPNNRPGIDYSKQVDQISSEEIINYLASFSETDDIHYLSDQLSDRSLTIVDQMPSQEIEDYLEYGL